MFCDIATKAGIAITAVALSSNIILCLSNGTSSFCEQLREITLKCKWLGFAYFILAWMIGGRNNFEEIIKWMVLASIAWLIVFLTGVISKIWSSGDKMSGKAACISIVYFVVAYLLH